MDENQSHLNNLATAHYAVGAFMALIACTPLFHAGLGLVFIFGEGALFGQPQERPPEIFGWMFFFMGLIFFIMGQAVAICVILSGRCLKQRKNYTFSFVIAGISCAMFPLGTILGVFTIIVLSRDPVKGIYGRA